MSRILVVASLVLALVFAPGSSRARRAAERPHNVVGISVRLLPGWRILHQPVTTCFDPKQRLAIASFRTTRLIGRETGLPRRGVLILLLEDRVNAATGFLPRTARFRLPAHLTRSAGCCDMPTNPGVEFTFRDHGRDFYAFVFAGRGTPRVRLREAVAILNSLRVGPS